MSELSDSVENLRKILDLEKTEGYQDSAVFGGLKTYIKNLSEKIKALSSTNHPESILSDMEALVGDYSKKPPREKRKVVTELEDIRRLLLVEIEEGAKKKRVEETIIKKPVRYAKGVGKKRARLLKKMGIESIQDLIFYFPYRIEDRRVVKKVARCEDGGRATIKGHIQSKELIKPRSDLEIVKVALRDNSGVAYGVWFNQPWIKNQLSKGERVAFYGEVKRGFGQIQIENPVFEPAGQSLHTSRLTPIYKTTQGLSLLSLRRIIWDNLGLYLDSVKEILPGQPREKYELLPRKKAIRGMHFPESLSEHNKSRKTLAFEELFIFQLGALWEKKRRSMEKKKKGLKASDQAVTDFLDSYPFELTEAQKKVIQEIRKDLAKPTGMRRLLQGDVGSGKTVVASLSFFICCKAGYQAALMAPTEILAEQHYWKLNRKLDSLTVKILKGSLPQSEKEALRQKVRQGEVDLLIGTHSLIQKEVDFNRLGLIVIDEQQRFGVAQRWELENKGENVDILVMSATPIPRTISLTLYGQFDFSVIDELPYPKRIKTYWVSTNRRGEVYNFVLSKIKQGDQAYVVYPLVEESDELDLKSAVQQKEELEQGVFKNFKVGLLYGQLSDEKKQQVLEDFRDGNIDLLVSTTVIEVGIDVPKVSLVVIEHADRFGLAQLHQLRGRIGRMGQESYCFAVGKATTEKAKRRLGAFRDISNGFKIAEQDLKIRGPGELLGLSQHGFDTTFKVVNLIEDLDLMKTARQGVRKFLAGQNQKSKLKPLLEEFAKRHGDSFKWAKV